jgi:DNA-binding IclR family transcriptional regulator
MVPAVQSALRLLRHLAEGDPVVTPAQTAKHLGINRTTLGRILSTLEAEGMIEKRHHGGGYSLGLGVRALCASALFSADFLQVADPILIELTESLGLSSHLGVLDGRSVVYLLRRVPNLHLVSNIQIGSRLPAHAVNAGRIILAYMPREKVIAIFDGFELEAVTDKTPTKLDHLLRQIDQDRQLGLAWSDSNFEIGISSVAAPIFDHAGQIIASVNVTGATQSFETNPQRRTEIGTAVSRAAHNISQRLGFSAPRSKALDKAHRMNLT